MKPVLTPRELAEAIGVSESSVKRWVDDGSIAASRTSGGHRRIPISEAVRFIRDTQSLVVRPDVMGLSDVASVADEFPPPGEEGEALYDYLAAGSTDEAKGLLLTLYLNGQSAPEIVDGPIRESMSRMGELWHHRPDGVFIEHRATELLTQALMRLRGLLPLHTASRIAVGGAAPGDIYQIPSLCAALVLEAAGVSAVNLGADVPVDSLEVAADRLSASLVWITATSSQILKKTGAEIRALAESLARRRIPLLVGGQQIDRLNLRSAGNLRVGRSMAELEAVAQGMAFAGGDGSPN